MEMKGKLNIFQCTVAIWNDLYPYNAVHVATIAGPFEPARLRLTISNILASEGLTGLTIDRRRNRFSFAGGHPDIQIPVIGRQGEEDALDREIERQLNTPWGTAGAMLPFRFFALPKDNGFCLGLVYYHLIAGADSIIALMNKIVESYLHKDVRVSAVPGLYPNRYRHSVRITPRLIFRWIRSYPEHISDLRKSCRPRYREQSGNEIGFCRRVIGRNQFMSLKSVSGQWGITLNDMFLALLLKAVAPCASRRFSARKRKNISVASIVNIRKDLSPADSSSFGLFLSSFNVSHAVPEGISIRDLASDVHYQTMKIKKDKLYLRTLIDMWAAHYLIRYFFRTRKKNFYAKYNPLWGGITNINLNPLWKSSPEGTPAGEGMQQPDYLRAVSTGHATPLVLSFTTVHDIINIGISFRRSVYSDSDIQSIMVRFCGFLDHLQEEQI